MIDMNEDRYVYKATKMQLSATSCEVLLPFEGSFAKETYNFIDPTNCSHPILPFEYRAGLRGI